MAEETQNLTGKVCEKNKAPKSKKKSCKTNLPHKAPPSFHPTSAKK